ncbi:hypothetical protein [Ekhidna sp.]|uniref:hypothetical protein n=1 Tax=Ekhidna sp. TaxID=2608089 RepID=UPI003BA8EFD4
MARDIAQETLKVGNALASVRIDEMIVNLAKGIAWGQYELDRVGVDITKMMGAPGTVTIGGDQISMLDAGFTPSFYHFVDTILEMKIEVNVREEESSSTNIKASQSGSVETSMSASMSGSASYNVGFFKAKMSMSASYGRKATSAYSRSLDSTSSQKYSQDLSASSLMRTKIVPIPPPELLLERIKILLEKLRKEAEEAEVASEKEALGLDKLADNKLFELTGISPDLLDNPDRELKKVIYDAFFKEEVELLKSVDITFKEEQKSDDEKITVRKWIVKDKIENKYIIALTSEEGHSDIMSVHAAGETQKSAFSFDDLLDLDIPA